MVDMMEMMLQSSTITTEIDGGTMRVPAFITENQAEGRVRPEGEVPAVVVVRVVDTQPEDAPEEETVQVAEVAQAVVVALEVVVLAAVALVDADDPSEIYLS